jgi:hypothetical protein
VVTCRIKEVLSCKLTVTASRRQVALLRACGYRALFAATPSLAARVCRTAGNLAAVAAARSGAAAAGANWTVGVHLRSELALPPPASYAAMSSSTPFSPHLRVAADCAEVGGEESVVVAAVGRGARDNAFRPWGMRECGKEGHRGMNGECGNGA